MVGNMQHGSLLLLASNFAAVAKPTDVCCETVVPALG